MKKQFLNKNLNGLGLFKDNLDEKTAYKVE